MNTDSEKSTDSCPRNTNQPNLRINYSFTFTDIPTLLNFQSRRKSKLHLEINTFEVFSSERGQALHFAEIDEKKKTEEKKEKSNSLPR